MTVQSELKAVIDLTPHPLNYNTHPEPQVNELQASLEQFDQFKNIVVWSPAEIIDLGNGQSLHPDVSYILAGHGFWMATSAAGREFIEVKDYTGIPYEEALLLMETDNASPVGAVVDAVKLAELAERTRGLVAGLPPGLEAMLERARMLKGVVIGGEVVDDPLAEWEGMPEFEQEDKTAFRSLYIHFKDQEAIDRFVGLIGQKITKKTRFLWYPKIEIETYADKRYIDAS